MSQARFDGGQSLVWEPLGTTTGGISAADPPTVLVALPAVPGGIYRVDYASITLRYLGATDGGATAELSASMFPGDYPPFLSCSRGSPDDVGFLGVSACCQLTLPFIITGVSALFMRCITHGIGNASNMSGVVSLSIARGF